MEYLIIAIIITLILGTFGFKLWISILNYKNRKAPVPKIVSDVYDEQKYKKWLDYNMENFRFSLVASSFDVVLIILLLFTGVFVAFKNISENLSNNLDIQILLFLGLYFLMSFIIDIFFSYYSHFSIEQRYGFNKTTKKVFIIDKIKNFFLTVIFGGALIFLLTTLFYSVGSFFYIYAWLSIVSILLFVNLFYVKLIVPLFNKLSPLGEGELKDKINDFAKKVGYEVSKISVIDASKRSTKLNAYFSGFGKLKQVVLYDTLIEKMSSDEIVAVLAHEIGHSKYKHIKSMIIQSILTLSVFLGVLLFTLKSPLLSTAFGFEDAHFGFGMIIFSIIISPISILITTLTSGMSRKHEYQADAYAASNGYKDFMVTALKTLAKENFSNLTPHPLYVKLTYSHPPLCDRLEAIKKIEV